MLTVCLFNGRLDIAVTAGQSAFRGGEPAGALILDDFRHKGKCVVCGT